MIKKPLRAVVFFSGSASSMRYLLAEDENYGKTYKFVGAFSDKPDVSGIKAAEDAGIPVKTHDFKKWRAENNIELGDINARSEYFKEVVDLIKDWRADILMFSGFMLVITNPLLSKYKDRILNVHPANLRIIDSQGKRKYVGPGDKVIREQIADGLKEVRSTIHIITREVDGGPIVAVSDPLPIEPGIKQPELQEKMKFACDGPAYKKAFDLITSGKSPIL